MKMKILCDPTLLILVIIMIVVYTIALIGTMFGIVDVDFVANPSELVPIRAMFGGFLLALYVSVIAASPRFLCTLTLSQTAITVWIPFRKSETLSYTRFRFVYCGKYFHGNIVGMGKYVWYIVISQKRLSTDELNAINQVPYSKEIIKIRYSEKTVKKLKRILPASLLLQLDSAITRELGVAKRNNGTKH